MEEINAKKTAVRKAAIKLRDSMEYSEVKAKSDIIVGRILKLDAFKRAEIIMSYINFKNEVITTGFIDNCLDMNKRVAVPVVMKTDKNNENEEKKQEKPKYSEIIASEIFNLKNDLGIGTYGILEPLSDKIRKIDKNSLDMIIIPGLAFDLRKNRLGFGAGYYDRFLKHIKDNCIKIGICFENQIVDNVPVNQLDIPMDMIITETRIIK